MRTTSCPQQQWCASYSTSDMRSGMHNMNLYLIWMTQMIEEVLALHEARHKVLLDHPQLNGQN